MGKQGFTPEERAKARESRKQTIATQKKAMLKALEDHYCIIKYAADKVGIDRGTHSRWMDKDEDYREKVMRIQENNLDFLEMNLYKRIAEGSDTLLMYALNNKGASRGYGKRLLEMGVGTTQELADIPKIVWVKSE